MHSVTRKLKLKGDLPFSHEMLLMNKYGYKLFARKNSEWVIYERPNHPIAISFAGLADDVVTDLTRRCNRIASSFQEPELHKAQIRMRLNNMARTLPTKQRAWVMDWIRRVIDEEDGSPPWEDENFEPNLGFC